MAGVTIKGIRQALAVLGRLPRLLQSRAERELEEFTRTEVTRIKSRASRVGRQQALAARSVRAERSMIVGAAGSGVPAAIFYGAEFGGRRRRTTQQFQPFRGQRGYFLFPQLRDDEGRLTEAFEAPADAVQKEWDD